MEKNICRGRHLTGLPVYNQQGELLGRVHQLAVDEDGQIRALALSEKNWVTWDQVIEYREDNLVVAGAPLAECPVSCPAWLDQPVINQKNQEIGRVGDLLLDITTAKLTGIELAQTIIDDLWQGRKEIPWQQLTRVKDYLLWLES